MAGTVKHTSSMGLEGRPLGAQKAALGVNDLTRDPGCLVARQERHEPRRVLGLADPAGGKFGRELLPYLLCHPARVRRAGVDGIYGYPFVADLGGERPGKGLDAPFGRSVGELPRHWA